MSTKKGMMLRLIKIYVLATFLTMGLILTYFGIRINLNSFKDGVETTATIMDFKEYDTDEKTGMFAYISYYANGKEYSNVELDYYKRDMAINDTLVIYYSEANPELVLSKQVKIFQTAIIYIGIGMVITGGIGVLKNVKFKR